MHEPLEKQEQDFSYWLQGWMAAASRQPTDPAFAQNADYQLGYFFGNDAFLRYCESERSRRGLPPISHKRN